jgi:predicted unusual protein kinase regulating ubiquinone biosynthesis (AarF/ABC1/UbiB family)
MLFASFVERPVASGSIARVQGAVLNNEREAVAVKVLKPGTHEIVRKGLSIMQLLLRFAGFFIAAVMGLWLLIGIIRSGRLR